MPVLVEDLHRAENTEDHRLESERRISVPPAVSCNQIAEDLVQDQIYTLWALGSIGDNSAVPGVLEQVKNQDPSVRKIAAYVLGVLGDPQAVGRSAPLLNDPKEDVRWNAALALALLGNSEGADLLMKLLDPSYVETLAGYHCGAENGVAG